MSLERPQSLRVLLVEDDPADARASMGRLRASSDPRFEVVHAGSVADALARLAEQPLIDAVLLDLGLPDLQGLDGLRAVRERAPHVPVVVLTNNEDQGLAELALASGAQDYVVKRASDGLALVRAITFAREREGRLAHIDRARRAAVHASAVKTELLGNVSHEIRTPLSTILGMGELLAETSLSPQQARYVESLRRAGDHLLSLVEDVLDLSRIEAGRLTLENNPFELARVVDRAIESLRHAAQRKGLELHSECSTDVPSWVLGDERRLRQILVNLLANGVKFTTEGSVRLTVVVDAERQVPGALRISVEDTGIGMPPDRLEAFFGSLVPGDLSVAPRSGGTGLGLHIVKELVGLMGGQVSAESTVGVGSRFQVRVSLEPADAAAGLRASQSPDAQAEPRPPGELSGLRVLLVDDSDESRALVQAYLSSTGASLEVATDAAQALAKLHRESFDVILMDLHLPGMDGFSATRELRRTERRSGTVPIPVVALSADALPETVEQALAAGFTEHLAKPLRKAALRALLRRYARSTGARPLLPPSATVSRLRPKFLEHRERDVATIRGALARKDFEIIATLGHNMRGTGVSYGYPEVSAIGGRLEAAAQAKNGRRIDEQIGRLEAWLLRIRNKLAAGRPASSTRVRATRKNQLQTGRTHKGER